MNFNSNKILFFIMIIHLASSSSWCW